MTECTALTHHPGAPQPPDSSSIDHFIEDFFNLNQEPSELWTPAHQNHHTAANPNIKEITSPTTSLRNLNKIRLNSYEESLSSPESVFSIRFVLITKYFDRICQCQNYDCRSRVSSGEDDLELFWRTNESKPPIVELEASSKSTALSIGKES